MLPSSVFRAAALMLGVCAAAVLPGSGQTFSASVGTSPVLGAVPIKVHPVMPEHPKDGDETLLYARVRDGVYSVDGLVAKLRLNYDVQAAKYMYMFVPGLGTAVISATPDADAVASNAALHESELSFLSADHLFTLTGVTVVNGKGEVPARLYVRFDREAWHLSRLPMIGYGRAAAMPYEWPGATVEAQMAQGEQKQEEPLAPPVPVSLLPSRKPVRPAQSPVSVDPAALGSAAQQPGGSQQP